MKIDLHCHTKATKSGDSPKRNVTKDVFAEKVSNANVKILAITNHNMFDREQYDEFRTVVESYCQVWPGVEIDVNGKTKWHMIVVANPDNVEEFSARVSALFAEKDINKCSLTMEEIYSSLNECDVIYIPHYHKNPGIDEEDRIKLQTLVKDDSRIFLETTNHRSLGVFSNHGYKSIIGSDVQDWGKYDSCDFAELKLPVESFHQFCLLSKRDTSVVETLLNKKESIVLTAKPHEDVSFQVQIYQDINIIFGPKGTGKTEILKSLYEAMVQKGINCTQYVASGSKEEFKSILSNSDMIRDYSIMGAESCAEDFKVIIDWNDVVPAQFSQYLSWYKTKDSSKNKSTMKITDASIVPYARNRKYDIHKKDKIYVSNVAENIKKIDLNEYLDKQSIDDLLASVSSLQNEIVTKRKNDLIDEEAHRLSEKTIEIIKTCADKNTDSISKPSTTGYIEFALNRIKLLNAVNHILETLALPAQEKTEELGILEDKGKLFVTSRFRFLCEDSTAEEFKPAGGYRKLKAIKKAMTEIKDHVFDDSLAIKVKNLIESLSENSVTSIDSFIGVSKRITDSTGKEYKPSNGEESIILLQRTLQKNVDAFFLDEPELGMGNSYIDATIRPMISDLAKKHKYVVIATHNANIAVRTLPYMSIFRNHGVGGYATYCGNPFNDLLINLDDDKDIKSWSEESLHTLEGGAEAFYERKEIYESKNN